MSGLSGSLDEDSIVGSHAAVDHPDVVGDLFDLEGRMFFVQDRLVLLFRRQNDAVRRLEADGGCAGGHGRQGVLDLNQLAGRAEISKEMFRAELSRLTRSLFLTSYYGYEVRF